MIILDHNYVKLADTEKVILGMVGLGPIWNRLCKKSVETMANRDITLLDRLHKKRLVDSSVVIEELFLVDSLSPLESSMDSIVYPLSSEARLSPLRSTKI